MSDHVENTCSICLDGLVEQLPCGHKFHPHCIYKWKTEGKATCPLCRAELQVLLMDTPRRPNYRGWSTVAVLLCILWSVMPVFTIELLASFVWFWLIIIYFAFVLNAFIASTLG